MIYRVYLKRYCDVLDKQVAEIKGTGYPATTQGEECFRTASTRVKFQTAMAAGSTTLTPFKASSVTDTSPGMVT